MRQIYLFAVWIVLSGLAACSDDSCQQRVQALEGQIKSDSMLMASIDRDFEEIGNELAVAMQFTNEASSGIMTKSQYKARIQGVTQTLERNSKKIAELIKELEKAKGSTKILVQQLKAKDQEIAALRAQIDQLNAKMAVVQSENVGLKATVAEKNTQISSMSSEIDNARNELALLQSQIAQAQKNLTDSYLNAGVLMMEIADKIDGVFKPKAKAEATQRAFDFFCAAHKRGHYNALTYISQLKSDKEFSKHLRGKNCD